MPQFGDVARTRDVETLSAMLGDSPDVTTEDGVIQAAEIVYRCVRGKINETKAPIRIRDSQKGYRWQGNIRREVFYALWPSLKQSMLIEKERANEIIGKILGKLDEDRILWCEESTKYTPSTWWINEHFLPSVTRKITDPEPEASPAQELSMKPYKCRECTERFAVEAARVSHETYIHKIVVGGEDDAVYRLDDSFTSEHIKSVLVNVMRAEGNSMTQRSLELAAVAIDPRMRKTVVATGLRMLLEAEVAEERQVGMRTRYQLRTKLPEPQQTSEAPELLPTLNVDLANPPPATSRSTRPLAGAVWTMQHLLASAQGCMDEAAKMVVEVEERATAMGTRLVEVERELASLKMKQVVTSTASPAQVKELEEELARVRIERDEYKGQWEVFQKAVRGVLKD